MITTTEILLAAASLAERQPTAHKAIGAALGFADKFPAAVRVLEAAEHRSPSESLFHALAGHCGRPVAVAESFRHAASAVTS